MTLYKWSQTAASNATADATINWAEGQAPSSVNDSSRAEMAAVAKFRDDLAASATTGGTSTAYTLTTNQVFNSLANMSGKLVGFTVNATNGANPTLNVDGLGAKALRMTTAVAMAANQLIAGSPYVALYNNSNSEFLIVGGVVRSVDIPQGTVCVFAQTSAPTGYTKGATHNDKALRVVTGAASSGGTSAFSTVFGLTSTDSYTLLTADIPSHTHPVLAPTSAINVQQGTADTTVATSSVSTNTSATGGGGGHSHGIELRVQYVDVILATKD